MKTKLFFLLIFNLSLLMVHSCMGQAGEWVWLKGDSIPNQFGNYGVQGVPSPTNNPPGVYEPCEWTDLNGNFWLFGGYQGSPSYVGGDLWTYNLLTDEWTWMKGPGVFNDPGNYGIQGIPSPTNNPPSRGICFASWVDNSGNLWMFGGVQHFGDRLSDLWKYNILTNEWTWMKGPNIPEQGGVYGVQGVPNSANNPGARNECEATWTDNSGNLWLFGGLGHNSLGFPVFNDLWKFNIALNNWVWMKGDSTGNAIGVYGTLGVETTLNTPRARCSYSHWKDNTGKFWLYGGSDNYFSPFNDLWRYNPATNNWAWMGGDSTLNATGNYGLKCISSPNNIPRARTENRAAWKDQFGNFWAFGGVFYYGGLNEKNDLWMYCLSTNQWIWQSGDSISNPIGHWGTMGISNPTNKPNGRDGSVGWTGNNGHLYLFGGWATYNHDQYNDLWKFTIDTACGVCPASTSIEENNNSASTIEIFPNPSSESFTIRSADYAIDKIEIFNLLGEEVYEKLLKATECQLLTRRFGNGIYIVKIYTHDRIYQKKLMVNH